MRPRGRFGGKEMRNGWMGPWPRWDPFYPALPRDGVLDALFPPVPHCAAAETLER